MKIIVTGLPRSRTSLIVNRLSESFSLKKPDNIWGETHKFNENLNEWLNRDNSIFKLWPIHTDDYLNILENTSGNVVVSYETDFPLFVAKLLRSHITKDWNINKRDIIPISFKQYQNELIALQPTITAFKNNLDRIFSNKKIILKSAFVKGTEVSVHLQSSFPANIVDDLRMLAKDYTKLDISNYIIEDKEEYYEFIYEKIGSGF
jgi:hypothetical protein